MKSQYGAEQIIGMLRQCDVMLAQGKSTIEVCRPELGNQISPTRRKAHGRMKVNQAECLKELGRENIWLKRFFADLTLDKFILKEAGERKLLSTQRQRSCEKRAQKKLRIF